MIVKVSELIGREISIHEPTNYNQTAPRGNAIANVNVRVHADAILVNQRWRVQNGGGVASRRGVTIFFNA